MRLVTFLRNDELRIGAESRRGIVDFHDAAPALPGSVLELLAAGPLALRTAQAVVARALDDGVGLLDASKLALCAPLPRPGKILGIALNYRDHAAETGQAIPEAPVVFVKAATAVIGPGAAIEIPAITTMVDYEGELAVVVGRRARAVRRERALAYIGGYTIMNDVSARDYQKRSGPSLAKSFDTFAPMGPVVVTPDELPDAARLDVRTLLNDVEVQHSNTSQLIFDVPTLIEYISAGMTLEPGDVITTGTPAGVGARRTPPRFLQPGDTVRVEIGGIGALENPVVPRAAAPSR